MTIEQELAEIIQKTSLAAPANRIAKAILSSGLVIPVSALDGMVDVVADGIEKRLVDYGFTKGDCSMIKIASLAAQTAINAIKKEAKK